tara:strand:- start:61 stop:753 length:693 start_codon:yes stop_codon:yes gene_type:complete
MITRTYQNIKLKFDITGNTYPPDKFTRLMANSIKVKGKTVIDVGTGSGALAIISKKLGAKKVTALDFVDEFKHSFQKNCALNKISLEFNKSNLLKNLNETPDIIIANLAQTPFPRSMDNSKWGGTDGTDKLREIIKQSYSKLKKHGKLYIGVVSLANPKRVEAELRKKFKVAKINQMRRYISPKIANKWQKGFFDYLLHQQKKGKSFIYKDGKKHYYKFYIFEAIKQKDL